MALMERARNTIVKAEVREAKEEDAKCGVEIM